MDILLENIGRRFNRNWIFKSINYHFKDRGKYAVLGPNGSGKSTFLQLLASSLTPSAGKITYLNEGLNLPEASFYQYFAVSAPYLELPEEFTLQELITFHFRFKQFRQGLSAPDIIQLLNLPDAADKEVRNFSSGMKQRTKLALAFCADTPVLLLDEPTTNLDSNGISWYLDLVNQFASDRLMVVCSNQPHEYAFCNDQLLIADFKG